MILVLSHDEGAWKKIQDEGQDLTFMPYASLNAKVFRYSGSEKTLPLKYELALFLKYCQQFFLRYSELKFFGSLIKKLANMRIADNLIDRIPSVCIDDNAKSIEISAPGKSWNKIVTGLPTHRVLIVANTVLAFRHVIENYDFDYLFRTNTSSYVDSAKLLEFLESKERSDVYGGFIGRICQDIEFASGAGILLSRDVVKQLCDTKIKWKSGFVDDVALAVALSEVREKRMPILSLDRLDIATYSQALSSDPRLIQGNYHFRCKTSTPDETIKIMHHIHDVKNHANMSDLKPGLG
jgi:hypothetical protein